ncbi:MAG: isopentenyl phosphate kinase, partial [Candidatus Diapherotrites archaeon]|nr:isopentenyl phosphate kinase [Candidatus Diapherotrites archaeon]
LKKKPFLKIVLVCGVGPFGHLNVIKYNLNNGIKTPLQEEGLQVTIEDCWFVAEEVVKALNEEGLKTKLVPGYHVCEQDNKKAISFNSAPYKRALDNGLIPVTTGTMVKDKTLNWSPMSGDVIVAHLAKQLIPAKVIMGTDVDGIFTADPKLDKNAELIEEINKKNLAEVLKKASKSNSTDVTGGMKGKLEKLAEQLNGTPCEIFNLFTEGNLKKVILGGKIKCTKLEL